MTYVQPGFLVAVHLNGKYPLAQVGDYRGFPSGQGLTVLEFARSSFNLVNLQTTLDKNRLYTPTAAQLDEHRKEVKSAELARAERMHELLRQGDGTLSGLEEWKVPGQPTLHPHSGADVLQLVADAKHPVPIVCNIDYIKDKSCRWAYIIDLDANVLEVYLHGMEGIEGRFKDIGGPGYVVKYELTNLPNKKKFLHDCGAPESDEEDENEEEDEEDPYQIQL
jgi:hypothetical protein